MAQEKTFFDSQQISKTSLDVNVAEDITEINQSGKWWGLGMRGVDLWFDSCS